MLMPSVRPMTMVVPLLLSVSLATSGCDIAMADLSHSATAEWRKTYELASGGSVEVGNVNGPIRVEPSEDGKVEIVAHKTAKGASEEAAKEALARLEIVEDVSSGRIKVETKPPRSVGMFGGSTDVAYAVRVPAGAEVKLTTVNGKIEVSNVTGRIKAETTNGPITAREVGGPIDASTTNGSVDIDVTQVARDGITLACTNGGIRIRIPSNASATISASVANGGIDVDGLDLDRTESSRRSLHARLNGGGPAVRIEGTNGGIRIGAR